MEKFFKMITTFIMSIIFMSVPILTPIAYIYRFKTSILAILIIGCLFEFCMLLMIIYNNLVEDDLFKDDI